MGIGKETTTDGSVIDYVIGSPFLLSRSTEFVVHDFDGVFSDKHSLVTWQIQSICNINKLQNQVINDNKTISRIIWKNENKGEYIENISEDRIEILLSKIDNNTVQEVTAELSKILLDPAIRVKRKNGAKKIHKLKCYNHVTRQMRQAYHKAKSRNNKLKTKESLEDLKIKIKTYRKQFNKSARKSRKELVKKLRSVKSKNAKEYWKILQNTQKKDILILIHELHKHFKNISEDDDENNNFNFEDISGIHLDTTELNCLFTEDEIKKSISKLKNGKAGGADEILNEHIKSTIDLMMPVYVKLFNKVVSTGEVPEDWLVGLIVPIFKQKGSKTDCNSYRGITLLSCLGKLFTSVLNERLYTFCEKNDILNEIQAGFRKGYSTMDHIFVLKHIIDLFISRKHKLYCCFVDYTKAFDTIWREALWHKLLSVGIEGKFLNVIKSMYSQVKSCVLLNGQKSDFFITNKGVRQGENLSPLLFALFVNDIEEYMLANGCSYVNIDNEALDNYIKLLVLMYADDTILIADSKENLQKAITCMETYCDKWKLIVNENKTKVMIFSKIKMTKNNRFMYKGIELVQVDTFRYLGLIINFNGSFKQAITELKNQASRAMYALIGKCRKLGLPIDLQLELFDRLIVPIMLYGCEVWGSENYIVTEKLHLKFLKHILGVHGKTTNNMVYGELGRFSLEIKIKKRMIGYWGRLIMGKQSKLSKVIYDQLLFLFNDDQYKSKWLMTIKSTLEECNMDEVWENQTFGTVNLLKYTIAKNLKCQFIVNWKNELNNMTSCDVYVHLKPSFKMEKYLICLNKKQRIAMCRFRTNNTRLPKVIGRFKQPKVERHKRFCTLCNETKLGDEYHILFECSNEKVILNRLQYVSNFYLKRPSMFQCINLMRSENNKDIRNLSLFLINVICLYK